MRLTFLGTGTSTGVPQMRCDCATCRSADPRDKRLRASALVETEEGAPAILIDCGPDFRQQMLRLGCPDIAALLITHSHYDHVGGVDDLRPYSYSAPGGRFPVYCLKDVARDLRSRIPYCFTEHPYPGVPQFDIHIIEPMKRFTVTPGEGYRPVEILPLPVMHGRLEILGYRIGPLAYITDASFVPQATLDAIKGVDTLIINALRHDTHPSHLNLNQALDVIKVTRPRQAYLTHMSHQMGLHEQAQKLLPSGCAFAYDGLTVGIAEQ